MPFAQAASTPEGGTADERPVADLLRRLAWRLGDGHRTLRGRGDPDGRHRRGLLAVRAGAAQAAGAQRHGRRRAPRDPGVPALGPDLLLDGHRRDRRRTPGLDHDLHGFRHWRPALPGAVAGLHAGRPRRLLLLDAPCDASPAPVPAVSPSPPSVADTDALGGLLLLRAGGDRAGGVRAAVPRPGADARPRAVRLRHHPDRPQRHGPCRHRAASQGVRPRPLAGLEQHHDPSRPPSPDRPLQLRPLLPLVGQAHGHRASRLPPHLRSHRQSRGRTMRTAARSLLIALLLLTAAATSHAQEGVVGRWVTPGVAAIVELAPCPGTTTLCGTIRWLWEAVDEKGQPRLDSQNADTGLRSRPLLGLAVLSGLTPAPGGVWSGRIYNPEDGQTYKASLRRTAADSLLVEGCVLVICRKQVWRKASVVAEALGSSSR